MDTQMHGKDKHNYINAIFRLRCTRRTDFRNPTEEEIKKTLSNNTLVFTHFMFVRASLANSSNFCTVWRINSDFYILSTHFFKYSFQQILYPILYLI